ncbi:MAG: hypothetical protein N4A68_19535 [Maledivibacter sp.]|jgi:RecA/RadA recombinase|nr:hypothetical protein [Maledivibacter sp.]
MKENFDCTQFITFNLEEIDTNIHELVTSFNNIGFKIIYKNQIREVKKEYFKDYIQDEFIEFKCDNFIGEFEDWESLEHPTEKILKFANAVENIARRSEINNFRIILTSFAQEGYSSNETIKVKVDNIQEGLFSMSKHYYDVWTDNLIIEII